MQLPSREECMRILSEHQVPENVIGHSIAVNRVSVFLAKRLKEKGEDVDVGLVDAASLLHDLDKIETLKEGVHGVEAKRILDVLGYPALGTIVQHHKVSFIDDLKTWEEKIVNYADKRCTNTEIVSLEERFDYLQKRYGHNYEVKNEEQRLSIKEKFFKLEQEIFSFLSFPPEKLREMVEAGQG